MYVCVDVFFFKQKTAYEMRISDWSSDVCSSDLARLCADRQGARGGVEDGRICLRRPDDRADGAEDGRDGNRRPVREALAQLEQQLRRQDRLSARAKERRQLPHPLRPNRAQLTPRLYRRTPPDILLLHAARRGRAEPRDGRG